MLQSLQFQHYLLSPFFSSMLINNISIFTSHKAHFVKYLPQYLEYRSSVLGSLWDTHKQMCSLCLYSSDGENKGWDHTGQPRDMKRLDGMY